MNCIWVEHSVSCLMTTVQTWWRHIAQTRRQSIRHPVLFWRAVVWTKLYFRIPLFWQTSREDNSFNFFVKVMCTPESKSINANQVFSYACLRTYGNKVARMNKIITKQAMLQVSACIKNKQWKSSSTINVKTCKNTATSSWKDTMARCKKFHTTPFSIDKIWQSVKFLFYKLLQCHITSL